jgi:hypothetical protein
MIARTMPDIPPTDDRALVVPFASPDANPRERSEENGWLLRVKTTDDAHAFRCLFDRLSPRVNSYLKREGVAPDAENALQDVWLVVRRKAGQFDAALASARTGILP